MEQKGYERVATKILITDPAIQALKEAEERQEIMRAQKKIKIIQAFLLVGWLIEL